MNREPRLSRMVVNPKDALEAIVPFPVGCSRLLLSFERLRTGRAVSLLLAALDGQYSESTLDNSCNPYGYF